MTIEEVTKLIERQAPGAPGAGTLDTIKSGDPSQTARGIVVTFMATCQVLQRAVELGANLVITHEPTFYNPRDETAWLEGDMTYSEKKEFIVRHGIVLWRYHDGPHRMKPDGILAGVIGKLGWKNDAAARKETVFAVEAQTVRGIALLCKERLGIPWVRVAGDPEAICSRIGILVGAWGGRAQIELFLSADVDAVLCGESPEWETCEYVRDASYLGRKKGLIVLGHANSEEAGMEWVANWLRGLIPAEIPITHVPAGDPFQFV